MISFAATVCLETCRHQGRRLLLGWTGPTPGARHGPASVKLLHELLDQLAVLRSASEGGLADLLDVLPPVVLREAILVVVSTRPLNLVEEADRSKRLAGTSARGLAGRISLLNASQGDLDPLFQPADNSTRNSPASPTQQRARGPSFDPGATAARAGTVGGTANPRGRGRSRRRRPGRGEAGVNSYYLYRASFYLMLTVATAALSGDTGEARFFNLYPWFVAIAGIVAFFTVDRQPRVRACARPVANVLALLTVVVLYLRVPDGRYPVDSALGHWLVYLQLVKYALPKTPEDDWFLFLLGLMQVLIGAVVSQSDRIGLWLFAWAMLAIWVLGQFFLQREAARFQRRPDTADPSHLHSRPSDPYAGLLDLPYVLFDGSRPGVNAGPGRTDLPDPASPGRRHASPARRTGGPAPDGLRRGGDARPVRRDPRE